MLQDNKNKNEIEKTESEKSTNARLNANASTRAHARDFVTRENSDDSEYREVLRQARDTFQKFCDQSVKSEAHLENIFRREVEKAGGMAIKFNPLGKAGLPDRIVFYMGFVWLVEMKTPKGRVQPIQVAVHRQFAEKGFKVRIIRTKEQIAAFVSDMENLIP